MSKLVLPRYKYICCKYVYTKGDGMANYNGVISINWDTKETLVMGLEIAATGRSDGVGPYSYTHD